jgi:hypothetical protein
MPANCAMEATKVSNRGAGAIDRSPQAPLFCAERSLELESRIKTLCSEWNEGGTTEDEDVVGRRLVHNFGGYLANLLNANERGKRSFDAGEPSTCCFRATGTARQSCIEVLLRL